MAADPANNSVRTDLPAASLSTLLVVVVVVTEFYSHRVSDGSHALRRVFRSGRQGRPAKFR
jgi:hypothetical protein